MQICVSLKVREICSDLFPVQYVTTQTVSGTGSLRLAGMFLVSLKTHN